MVDLVTFGLIGEIAGRYRRLGPLYPGIGLIAKPLLLELVEEVAKSTAQDAAGRAAGEQSAQSAFHEIAEAAAHTLPPGIPAFTGRARGRCRRRLAPTLVACKMLDAFRASSARIAMVIGDMPPPSDCELGALGPRGPFYICRSVRQVNP